LAVEKMRFRFSQEQQQFRQEVCEFLREEMSPEYETIFGTFSEEKYWFSRDLYRRLAEKGWLTIGWPTEYGGGGKTFLEQSILDEQIGYHLVQRVGITGLNFSGPAIIKFGTPEQKARYLPPIARGEAEYCQGFTEPDAGSDLASLQMRAEADGEYYVLNGSKMFTSYYAHADFIYLLARTDPDAPKHRGISLFIVEMDTPGITTRPLPYINGEVAAQTFFDDVRVPRSCLVGQENQGWYHAMTTLDYERAGLERYARVRRTFDDFVAFCKTAPYRDSVLGNDPVVRYKLAKIKVGLEGWAVLCWKVAWMQSRGEVPNAEASIAFLYGTQQRLYFAEEAMEILGRLGTLTPESSAAPIEGSIEGLSRESMHMHGAGTMEIHRNIIAQRGLGLPR
jgi:alkylation response protein AidB-like acyl-CoA dehydrogenase